MTADLRLDNREELIDALGLHRSDSATVGDAALVLEAWERWGEEGPARLLGDFALAVWDVRRKALFCARDPAGVKPFYYYLGPRTFAFASEVKALLSLSEVPRRLDDVKIGDLLVGGVSHDRTATCYAGVRRLAPGHALRVEQGGGAPKAYWQLDATREIQYDSDATYAEAFGELFGDAVRRRLRSVGPVGAALSGGLDSSSVVCVARSLHRDPGGEPLRTYSAIFPTLAACDERPFIDAVISGGGLESHYLQADILDPLGDLEGATWLEHETLRLPSYYMHWWLYRAARQDGVRVFLEGTGGDLVVSHGVGRLADLAAQGRWLALLRETRQLQRVLNRSAWDILRSPLAAVVPPVLPRAWRWVQYGGQAWDPLLRADFARRIDLAERLRARDRRARDRRDDAGDGSRGDQLRRLTSVWLADVLEALEGAAGAVGLEVRDPFLDRRLMEFCLALPASQKIRDGRTRGVMRHALGRLLPPSIRDRPGKAPLDAMLPRALETYGRNRLDRLMGEAGRVLEPYINPRILATRYARYLARGTRFDLASVWVTATLTLWLRRAGIAP